MATTVSLLYGHSPLQSVSEGEGEGEGEGVGSSHPTFHPTQPLSGPPGPDNCSATQHLFPFSPRLIPKTPYLGMQSHLSLSTLTPLWGNIWDCRGPGGGRRRRGSRATIPSMHSAGRLPRHYLGPRHAPYNSRGDGTICYARPLRPSAPLYIYSGVGAARSAYRNSYGL